VTLESLKNTLSGNNTDATRALRLQLDAYNNSCDDVALDPSLPPTGRADPNGAREIAANQALATILNSAMPGGKPLPAGYSLSSIASTLGGSNIPAIKTLSSDLDKFNNSGDNIAFDPNLQPTGKADPKGAKAIANIAFAD